MGFTIPDNTDAGVAEVQATWMQTDIDILTAGFAGDGVLSGCAVTAQGTPDMTVAVAAGSVHCGGTNYAVSAGNVTVSAAHATLNRIDLVYIDGAGAKQISAGTAAADPGPPSYVTGTVALAFVYVPGADTDIDAIQIVDKRVMLPPVNTTAIEFVIDGGGSAITTGVKGDIMLPFAGIITGWRLAADQAGSIVLDVWKDSYANFPPADADSIAGSELPTLSSANKAEDTALGTWTTAFAAGDWLRFNVDSASTVTRVTVVLLVTRT